MMPEAVATTAVHDHKCILGEGSAYDAASDSAWWFDILGKTLFEHHFATGATTLHELPFIASQISFIDDERQLIWAESGLHVREIAGGRLTLHTAIEKTEKITRSNDGRVHPCGALWMGTMGKEEEKGAGAIYWFFRGELKQLYRDVSIPNTICFSADGATAYFSDTPTGLLMRVATDPATGLPLGEPTIFNDSRKESGGPDGALVDAEGCLWNARWGGSRIDVYAPDGSLQRSIGLPVSQPTCPLFIGAKADRMMVTSAQKGTPTDDLTTEPDAGRTLLLDLSVKGKHDPRVLID